MKIHILTSLFSSLLLNFGSTSYVLSNEAKDNESLISNSTVFPMVQEVLDFMNVATLVKTYDSCEEIESKDIFPDGAECSYYVESEVTTKAIIVTSPKAKIISVVFAGPNGIEDAIFLGEITQVPLGPHGNPIIDDVKVHAGCNDLLFYYGLFFDLLDRVKEYHEKNPEWRIYTSGHGLGAGVALLMAAGISQNIPDASITNIGTATPVMGDEAWFNYMNNNTNINVWNYVYDNDIVPRLRIPPNSWFHVGNTFQLNKQNVKIFYLHYGDRSLGYAGVPPSWDLRGLNNPLSALEHSPLNYVNYLKNKSMRNPEKYYGDEFVKCTKITCPEDYDGTTS